MNKYNKPKIAIIEIETTIIASPSSGLTDAGNNESWESGIVEEFDWGN